MTSRDKSAAPWAARSDSFHKHTASLRRLSADISRFRAGDVQAALATTPTRGNADEPLPPPDASPAILHAALLATRAELSQAAVDRDAALRARVSSDARADNAVADVATIRDELSRLQAEHEAEREAGSEEVARLERERIMLAKDSAEKTELLRNMESINSRGRSTAGAGVGPGIATGSASLVEDPTLSARFEELSALSARQRRQVEAAENEKRVMREAHILEVESRVQRISELEALLSAARCARAEAISERAAVEREYAEKESATRSELVAIKSELAVRVAELASVRAERVTAEEKLFEADAEARRLRVAIEDLKQANERLVPLSGVSSPLGEEVNQTSTATGASGHSSSSAVTIATLKKEIAKLSDWVCAISPSGTSLEDGLVVLENAAADRNNGTIASLENESDLQGQTQKQQGSAVATLQQQHKLAFARLNSKISDLSESLEVAKLASVRAAAERDEYKLNLERGDRLRQMLERKGKHLKMIIDEIEGGIETGKDDESHALALSRTRLKETEELCGSYKQTADDFGEQLKNRDETVRSLSVQVASCRAQISTAASAGNAVSELRGQLLRAVREATEAKAARDEALSRAAALEKETSSSKCVEQEVLDYDPNLLKVVHLKEGLAAKTEQESDGGGVDRATKRRRLRDGNSNIDELEPQSGAGFKDLVSKIEALEQRNQELQQLSKLGERTKEVARRKIEEVRQACLSLFGWTMRIQGATYRLTSIYAEGRDDELVFGAGRNGAMTLHANAYSQQIGDDVEQFMQKWNSVPALLSSVTLSNFEKTTVVTG